MFDNTETILLEFQHEESRTNFLAHNLPKQAN